MFSLQGKNIKLRAMEPSDIDTLYEWENAPDIWHYGETLTPFSKFHLEQFILNSNCNIYLDRQLRLIITDIKGSSTGIIDLFDFDAHHRRAAIGILIAKQHRNKGYATDALDAIIEYGKNVLSLHQLYCNITTDNETSIKLFKSKGFEVAGVKKQWKWINNQWKDEYTLQLIFK